MKTREFLVTLHAPKSEDLPNVLDYLCGHAAAHGIEMSYEGNARNRELIHLLRRWLEVEDAGCEGEVCNSGTGLCCECAQYRSRIKEEVRRKLKEDD